MYHMSITVQEAYLLADILDRHLDDYVEELTREKFSNPNTDQTKAYILQVEERRSSLTQTQSK